MALYFIGRLKLKDASWMAEYAPPTRALVEKHGGRHLVVGGEMQQQEGDGPLPDSMVVLEFPTKEQALAWHNDPDYAPLIALRQSGSDLDFVLVEGAE
jgi:uncharacterized protein (DUF1330 family)